MAHDGHIIIPGDDSLDAHTKAEYGDAEYIRKPHGMVFVNGKEVASTLQCCHCGKHWIPKRGSGIRRGLCGFSMQPLCGAQACFDRCTCREMLV